MFNFKIIRILFLTTFFVAIHGGPYDFELLCYNLAQHENCLAVFQKATDTNEIPKCLIYLTPNAKDINWAELKKRLSLLPLELIVLDEPYPNNQDNNTTEQNTTEFPIIQENSAIDQVTTEETSATDQATTEETSTLSNKINKLIETIKDNKGSNLKLIELRNKLKELEQIRKEKLISLKDKNHVVDIRPNLAQFAKNNSQSNQLIIAPSFNTIFLRNKLKGLKTTNESEITQNSNTTDIILTQNEPNFNETDTSYADSNMNKNILDLNQNMTEGISNLDQTTTQIVLSYVENVTETSTQLNENNIILGQPINLEQKGLKSNNESSNATNNPFEEYDTNNITLIPEITTELSQISSVNANDNIVQLAPTINDGPQNMNVLPVNNMESIQNKAEINSTTPEIQETTVTNDPILLQTQNILTDNQTQNITTETPILNLTPLSIGPNAEILNQIKEDVKKTIEALKHNPFKVNLPGKLTNNKLQEELSQKLETLKQKLRKTEQTNPLAPMFNPLKNPEVVGNTIGSLQEINQTMNNSAGTQIVSSPNIVEGVINNERAGKTIDVNDNKQKDLVSENKALEETNQNKDMTNNNIQIAASNQQNSGFNGVNVQVMPIGNIIGQSESNINDNAVNIQQNNSQGNTLGLVNVQAMAAENIFGKKRFENEKGLIQATSINNQDINNSNGGFNQQVIIGQNLASGVNSGNGTNIIQSNSVDTQNIFSNGTDPVFNIQTSQFQNNAIGTNLGSERGIIQANSVNSQNSINQNSNMQISNITNLAFGSNSGNDDIIEAMAANNQYINSNSSGGTNYQFAAANNVAIGANNNTDKINLREFETFNSDLGNNTINTSPNVSQNSNNAVVSVQVLPFLNSIGGTIRGPQRKRFKSKSNVLIGGNIVQSNDGEIVGNSMNTDNKVITEEGTKGTAEKKRKNRLSKWAKFYKKYQNERLPKKFGDVTLLFSDGVWSKKRAAKKSMD